MGNASSTSSMKNSPIMHTRRSLRERLSGTHSNNSPDGYTAPNANHTHQNRTKSSDETSSDSSEEELNEEVKEQIKSKIQEVKVDVMLPHCFVLLYYRACID